MHLRERDRCVPIVTEQRNFDEGTPATHKRNEHENSIYFYYFSNIRFSSSTCFKNRHSITTFAQNINNLLNF